MTASTEPRVRTLRAYLERGIAPGFGGLDVRRELGMPASASDADVARSLAQIVSAIHIASIDARSDGPPREPRSPTMGALEPTDASFLGQLSVSGATELAVDDLDDPRTLVCVLRAGSLRQRRAAARRLTSLLRETESIDHAADVGREIRDLREAAIEHELRELRAEVPGGRSDEEDAPLGPTVKEVERAIRAFWEAETSTEPLAELGNVRRVLLLHRMRELPDAIVRHVAAVIEGEDGTSSISARREIASVCRHAGDPRLVPALTGVLSAGPVELRVDAARALAGIEDRRVAPALRAAYERSVDERERAEIGGALGAAGDMRAAPFVRSLLSRDDRELRLAALRALEHLGDTADVDALMAGLVPGNDEEVWQTIRTLGRIGDGRALPVLGQLHTSASIPGLRAEIEDAEAAIRARMEVRGEELDAVVLRPEREEPHGVDLDAPVLHRLRGLLDFVAGHVLLALGAVRAGVVRLERSAERRPRWSTPWVAIAMAWSRRGQHAAALGAFRRALSADRVRLERNPIIVRALARAFLRRAEEVERDGRTDIARGLLGEALAFDLRRAPSTLRFELKRQHELLRPGSSE